MITIPATRIELYTLLQNSGENLGKKTKLFLEECLKGYQNYTQSLSKIDLLQKIIEKKKTLWREKTIQGLMHRYEDDKDDSKSIVKPCAYFLRIFELLKFNIQGGKRSGYRTEHLLKEHKEELEGGR